jgi:hypothetical protein
MILRTVAMPYASSPRAFDLGFAATNTFAYTVFSLLARLSDKWSPAVHAKKVRARPSNRVAFWTTNRLLQLGGYCIVLMSALKLLKIE